MTDRTPWEIELNRLRQRAEASAHYSIAPDPYHPRRFRLQLQGRFLGGLVPGGQVQKGPTSEQPVRPRSDRATGSDGGVTSPPSHPPTSSNDAVSPPQVPGTRSPGPHAPETRAREPQSQRTQPPATQPPGAQVPTTQVPTTQVPEATRSHTEGHKADSPGGRRGLTAVTEAEQHTIDIEVPEGYPQNPPRLYWVTEICHPNVMAGRWIELSAIGLAWDPQMNLAIICERIWDVARGAFLEIVDPGDAATIAWDNAERSFQLPLDSRPWRAVTREEPLTNIVFYRRKRGAFVQSGGQARAELAESTDPGDSDVFYIGD